MNRTVSEPSRLVIDIHCHDCGSVGTVQYDMSLVLTLVEDES